MFLHYLKNNLNLYVLENCIVSEERVRLKLKNNVGKLNVQTNFTAIDILTFSKFWLPFLLILVPDKFLKIMKNQS